MTALLLRLLLLPAPAFAHGGFHESNDIGEAAPAGTDPKVVTNYGLLVPVSGSPDWAWVCEEVVGPQGGSAALEIDGRWLLGSFDGVRMSEDLCDWPLDQGALLDLYVTALVADPAVAGRVWATSSTGGVENALWRSDDRGTTWTDFARFGEGTTLRGVGLGPTGTPVFTAGWDGLQPMAWISQDGTTFVGHALPVDDVYSVAVLGADADAAWLRLAGASSDALVRLEPDGTLTEVLRLADVITAFDLGPGADEVYVGGKSVGLYYSADDGQSWSEPVLSPQPGCLRTRGGERFLCGHNWADGAAVLKTPLQGGDPSTWAWEEVLWFGDVRGVQDCPADSDVMAACAPIWEVARSEAGFDQDRDSGSSDGGGGDDTGTPPAKDGCCSSSGKGALLLLPGLGLLLGRRRRR